MTHFQIVELEKDGSIRPHPEFGLFEDGKRGAEFALLQSNSTGRKFQPRPVQSEEDWRQRERQRFESGIYEPLPWAHKVTLTPDHFAHISKKDPSKVAYTQSEDTGKADRQATLPVSRYLTSFHPELTITERRLITNLHLGIGDDEVHFAATEEEILKVYMSGPGSCMTDSAEEYASSRHPLVVYAAGDLAIAYLGTPEDRVIARAVCWPAKKIYGRVYGLDSDDQHHLESCLKEIGFLYSKLGFQGARLLRIEDEGWDDEEEESVEGFVAPYCDVCPGAVDNDDFLILDADGPIGITTTRGISYDRDREKCRECGSWGRGPYVSAINEVVCTRCAVKGGYICAVTGEFATEKNSHLLPDGRRIMTSHKDTHLITDPIAGEVRFHLDPPPEAEREAA